MKVPAIALAAALMSACATASLDTPAAYVAQAKALVVAESAFDGAVEIADTLVQSGVLTAAEDQQIGQIAADGLTADHLARKALKAADAQGVAAQTAAFAALFAKLEAVLAAQGA